MGRNRHGQSNRVQLCYRSRNLIKISSRLLREFFCDDHSFLFFQYSAGIVLVLKYKSKYKMTSDHVSSSWPLQISFLNTTLTSTIITCIYSFDSGLNNARSTEITAKDVILAWSLIPIVWYLIQSFSSISFYQYLSKFTWNSPRNIGLVDGSEFGEILFLFFSRCSPLLWCLRYICIVVWPVMISGQLNFIEEF